MQKIDTFLWFNDNAEEAAKFYVSIFKNSKITHIERYGDAGPGPKGSVMIVNFKLEGQNFIALNGGPQYSFTPAISFLVNCDDQKEIDRLWKKLTTGGKEIQCGWLQDKYGVSWQIVPKIFFKMIKGKDRKKSQRVFAAMMQMVKFDIAALKRAYNGN
jgi:predicted 3-demethylubiquinone-9 3-methyltransferase (glyoxalase superfamily)